MRRAVVFSPLYLADGFPDLGPQRRFMAGDESCTGKSSVSVPTLLLPAFDRISSRIRPASCRRSGRAIREIVAEAFHRHGKMRGAFRSYRADCIFGNPVSRGDDSRLRPLRSRRPDFGKRSVHAAAVGLYTTKKGLLAKAFGWKMGLEPTTFGTTIRRSNQLSYIHHVLSVVLGQRANLIHFSIIPKF